MIDHVVEIYDYNGNFVGQVPNATNRSYAKSMNIGDLWYKMRVGKNGNKAAIRENYRLVARQGSQIGWQGKIINIEKDAEYWNVTAKGDGYRLFDLLASPNALGWEAFYADNRMIASNPTGWVLNVGTNRGKFKQQVDFNVYTGLQPGNMYNNNDTAGWKWGTSANSNYIQKVLFSYEQNLPAGFSFQAIDAKTGTVLWTGTTTSQQTGASFTISSPGVQTVAFRIIYSGIGYMNSGNDGLYYAQIWDCTFQFSTATPSTTDVATDFAAVLATYTQNYNQTQGRIYNDTSSITASKTTPAVPANWYGYTFGAVLQEIAQKGGYQSRFNRYILDDGANTVAAGGAWSYYRLNAAGASETDQGSAGKNMTHSAARQQVPSLVPGDGDTAIQYFAAGFSSAASYTPYNGQMTWGLWFQASPNCGTNVTLCGWSNTAPYSGTGVLDRWIYLNTSGTPTLYLQPSSGITLTFPTAFDARDGLAHFVAGRIDPTNSLVSLIFDGQVVSTTGANGYNSYSTPYFLIASGQFAGVVDEAFIFQRVLTDQRLKQYAAPSNPIPYVFGLETYASQVGAHRLYFKPANVGFVHYAISEKDASLNAIQIDNSTAADQAVATYTDAAGATQYTPYAFANVIPGQTAANVDRTVLVNGGRQDLAGAIMLRDAALASADVQQTSSSIKLTSNVTDLINNNMISPDKIKPGDTIALPSITSGLNYAATGYGDVRSSRILLIETIVVDVDKAEVTVTGGKPLAAFERVLARATK